MNTPRPFFCVKEASVWSGLSLAELYRLAQLREVAFFYEGVQMRFYAEDLARFLAAEGQSDLQRNHEGSHQLLIDTPDATSIERDVD